MAHNGVDGQHLALVLRLRRHRARRHAARGSTASPLLRALRRRQADTGHHAHRARPRSRTACAACTTAPTTTSSSRSRSSSFSRACRRWQRRGRSAGADAAASIANLQIDLMARKAWRGGGTRIDLSAKEFALLAVLARRQGEILSKTAIAELVWDMKLRLQHQRRRGRDQTPACQGRQRRSTPKPAAHDPRHGLRDGSCAMRRPLTRSRSRMRRSIADAAGAACSRWHRAGDVRRWSAAALYVRAASDELTQPPGRRAQHQPAEACATRSSASAAPRALGSRLQTKMDTLTPADGSVRFWVLSDDPRFLYGKGLDARWSASTRAMPAMASLERCRSPATQRYRTLLDADIGAFADRPRPCGSIVGVDTAPFNCTRMRRVPGRRHGRC